AAAVATATLVGCGSSAKALTKAEFVKQGDVICKRANDTLNKKGLAIFVLRPTAKELSGFLGEAIPIFNGALTELDKLKPPKADHEAFQSVFGNGPPTLDAWKSALPKVIALNEKEQSDFAALTPPAADKAAFDAALAKEREVLDKARVALAAAVAGDRDGFRK